GAKRERIIIKGEITSPINPPDECRFYKRCNYACDKCKSLPELQEIKPGHFVACHRIGEI
ncbi:MAG: peptide ABC transporter ATP-binding protein, partial [Firmicutes bacterium]|nr:peptide ABC transporter ATP-binding protein [Bacillota bacterium]